MQAGLLCGAITAADMQRLVPMLSQAFLMIRVLAGASGKADQLLYASVGCCG